MSNQITCCFANNQQNVCTQSLQQTVQHMTAHYNQTYLHLSPTGVLCKYQIYNVITVIPENTLLTRTTAVYTHTTGIQ